MQLLLDLYINDPHRDGHLGVIQATSPNNLNFWSEQGLLFTDDILHTG